MITKNELRLYRQLKKEAKELAEQIEELELTMIVPGCQQITGMPMYHSADHDKIANVVAKAEQMRKVYFDKMNILLDLQADIEAAIEKLEPEERRLIRLYYFTGITWEEVAVQMNYCWQHVHKLHRNILVKLAKMR